MGAAPRKDSGVNKFRDDCRKLVRECQHPELTVTAKFVLLTLIDYINSRDHTAWPSFNTLVEDTGVCRRAVINAINTGRQLGLLKRVYKGGKKRRGGVSNRYTFNLAPDDLQPSDTPDPTSAPHNLVHGGAPGQHAPILDLKANAPAEQPRPPRTPEQQRRIDEQIEQWRRQSGRLN